MCTRQQTACLKFEVLVYYIHIHKSLIGTKVFKAKNYYCYENMESIYPPDKFNCTSKISPKVHLEDFKKTLLELEKKAASSRDVITDIIGMSDSSTLKKIKANCR